MGAWGRAPVESRGKALDGEYGGKDPQKRTTLFWLKYA